MYKRDLIVDEIQKLARALARIMGLKQEGKADEAMEIVNEELTTLFRKKAEDLALVPDEELMQEFPDDGVKAEHANALGELLFFYAESELEKGNTDLAFSVFKKVQLLWDHAEAFSRSILFDRTAKRKRISDLLKD